MNSPADMNDRKVMRFPGNVQIESIDKDDYFAKNVEFAAWLREQRGKFFNELGSDETRALFGAHLFAHIIQALGNPCHAM